MNLTIPEFYSEACGFSQSEKPDQLTDHTLSSPTTLSYWVYVSSASYLFSDTELFQLLEKSRQNNARLGLTGLLLYKDGNFIQMLEGPQNAVQEMAGKIARDQRHHGILSLIRGNMELRLFPNWSMGFVTAKELSIEQRMQINTFLQQSKQEDAREHTTGKGFKESDARSSKAIHPALNLMETFRQSM